MDYEKKYKEALDNFKKIKAANKDNKELVNFIEYEYPELKKSEDGMIIDAIKHGLKCLGWEHINGIRIVDIVAWLEKQGENHIVENNEKVYATSEQIPANFAKTCKDEQKPKFRVGDTIKCKYDDRQFTIKSVDLDKRTYTYTQEGRGNDIDYADKEFELVEHKLAWSEEDEKIMQTMIKEGDLKPSEMDWLKSLKDRI